MFAPSLIGWRTEKKPAGNKGFIENVSLERLLI